MRQKEETARDLLILEGQRRVEAEGPANERFPTRKVVCGELGGGRHRCVLNSKALGLERPSITLNFSASDTGGVTGSRPDLKWTRSLNRP